MKHWILIATVMACTACTSMLVDSNASLDRSTTGPRIGTSHEGDQNITTNLHRAFVADSELSSYPIGIRTIDSVVTLTGTVSSFDARDRAVSIAEGMPGVGEVRDRIAVNSNL